MSLGGTHCSIAFGFEKAVYTAVGETRMNLEAESILLDILVLLDFVMWWKGMAVFKSLAPVAQKYQSLTMDKGATGSITVHARIMLS